VQFHIIVQNAKHRNTAKHLHSARAHITEGQTMEGIAIPGYSLLNFALIAITISGLCQAMLQTNSVYLTPDMHLG